MSDTRSHRRTRGGESEGFVCRHCGRPVGAESYGTRHRNHCPWCLWSLHVDESPGDRSAACGSPMEPIAVWVRDSGEWCIVHRCCACGALHSNRIAGDDHEWALMALAARALSQPPFPLEV